MWQSRSPAVKMPSRRNSAARRWPNAFEKRDWVSSERGCAGSGRRSACDGSPGSLREITPRAATGERCGVEWAQVVDAFADADELDGDIQRFVHRHDHAALRRPVHFVTTTSRSPAPARRRSCLRDGVLADRPIEHEQRLVRRTRQALGDTRATFLSSSMSSPLVCRRPAVSMMITSAPRVDSRFDRVHATAAGSPPAGARRRSPRRPFRPHAQLIDRAGAKGVAGGDRRRACPRA